MEDEMTVDDLTQNYHRLRLQSSQHIGSRLSRKVYENALRIELEKAGFRVKQQEPIKRCV